MEKDGQGSSDGKGLTPKQNGVCCGYDPLGRNCSADWRASRTLGERSEGDGSTAAGARRPLPGRQQRCVQSCRKRAGARPEQAFLRIGGATWNAAVERYGSVGIANSLTKRTPNTLNEPGH